MEIDEKVAEYLADKQFEIIGEKLKYKDIPEDGLIEINKKKIRWWEYYKFENKQQYEEWKLWALGELRKENIENQFDVIDMTYGLDYKIPKIVKGQTALF